MVICGSPNGWLCSQAYRLVNRSDFEVDHLVSLELGGSNELKNLWPQPLHDSGGNGAVDKDWIENHLHDLVCAGEVALTDAQTAIVHWDKVGLASLVSTTTTTTSPPTPVVSVTEPPAAEPPPPPSTTSNVLRELHGGAQRRSRTDPSR